MTPDFKPRIFIERRHGCDWLGRSHNLWCGVNPYPEAYKDRRAVIYLGAVRLFDVEDTWRSYRRKLLQLERRVERLRARGMLR